MRFLSFEGLRSRPMIQKALDADKNQKFARFSAGGKGSNPRSLEGIGLNCRKSNAVNKEDASTRRERRRRGSGPGTTAFEEHTPRYCHRQPVMQAPAPVCSQRAAAEQGQ